MLVITVSKTVSLHADKYTENPIINFYFMFNFRHFHKFFHEYRGSQRIDANVWRDPNDLVHCCYLLTTTTCVHWLTRFFVDEEGIGGGSFLEEEADVIGQSVRVYSIHFGHYRLLRDRLRDLDKLNWMK